MRKLIGGSGIVGAFFLSDGDGTDVDGPEDVVGEDGESYPGSDALTVGKDMNHSLRCIRCDIILNPRRRQRSLSPIFADDIAREIDRILAGGPSCMVWPRLLL